MNDQSSEKSLDLAATEPERGLPLYSLPSLFLLLAIFFVFYAVELTSFPFSIDEEVAALRPDRLIWVEQGRWTIYLFETFIMPQPVMPFLPALLFGFFLASGYLVLLKGFGLSTIAERHLAAFALFCGFPIWYFLLEFQANTPAEGLGVLSACAATSFVARAIDSLRKAGSWPLSTFLWASAAGGLGAVAIGAYQSNAILLTVLDIALVVWTAKTDPGEDIRAIFRNLAIVLLALLIAAAAYSVINVAFQDSLGATPGYVNDMIDPGQLYRRPGHVIRTTLKQMRDVYLGSSATYGVTAFSFGLIVVTGLVALHDRPPRDRRISAILGLLATLMLVMPFALNLISASGGVMPYRSLVAVPMVMWFFAFLGFSAKPRWLVRTTAVVLGVSVFHMLYIGNLFQASNSLVRQHDLVTAAAIYNKIASVNSNFDRSRPYKIDFVGNWYFPSIYPKPMSSTVGASFFEWDGGNQARMYYYMRVLGYDNLELASKEQRKLLMPIVE
jgi:hypothetical protein